MESPLPTANSETPLTERLRLEPVDSSKAADLWLVQSDDSVWPSYGGEKPCREQIEQQAMQMGDSWRHHGVHKWLAYDRFSGAVIGRGGLSRTPLDDDWGQVHAFLPNEPWTRAAHASGAPHLAHAN